MRTIPFLLLLGCSLLVGCSTNAGHVESILVAPSTMTLDFSPETQVCIGFTGPACDYSYQATECGIKAAMLDMRGQRGTIEFGGPPSVIYMSGKFCSEEEYRRYTKVRPEAWLPWNRQYRITLQGISVEPIYEMALIPKSAQVIGHATDIRRTQ